MTKFCINPSSVIMPILCSYWDIGSPLILFLIPVEYNLVQLTAYSCRSVNFIDFKLPGLDVTMTMKIYRSHRGCEIFPVVCSRLRIHRSRSLLRCSRRASSSSCASCGSWRRAGWCGASQSSGWARGRCEPAGRPGSSQRPALLSAAPSLCSP